MTDQAINHHTVSLDVDHGLPGYDEAMSQPPVNNELPPSYDTFLGQLRKAKEESSNPADYVLRACTILCGSIFITICFALSTAVPIAMIVIGAVYKEKCPVENKIPIWLIVAGAFGCLSAIFRTSSNCYSLYKKKQDQNYQENKKGCFTWIIELFIFAWFICGNVWVYSVRNIVSNDPLSAQYCHSTCYYFAFWIITLSWILGLLCCCCCCCILLIAGCGLGVATLLGDNK